MNEEEKQARLTRAMNLADQGIHPAEIGRMIGVSRERVYTLLKGYVPRTIFPKAPPQGTCETRFWEKVDKVTQLPCWVFKKVNATGHGKFNSNIKGVGNNPPRYSYYIHFNVVPGTMWVRSTCNNPSCVNPKHLYLVHKPKEE